MEREEPYAFLPFNWRRKKSGRVYLTSEVGDSVTLAESEFEQFVDGTLPLNSVALQDLFGAGIAAEQGGLKEALDLTASRLRTRYSAMQELGGLHIFVVTLRCNQSCGYCQVSRVSEDKEAFDMSRETASGALDLAFSSPSRTLKIEFQGGESLLNFDLIQWIVAEARVRAEVHSKDVEFVIATNLIPATQEILEFCRDQSIVISTSIDGPEDLHDANRPVSGGNAYSRVVEKIELARKVLGHERVSALMTTSHRSMGRVREIIDQYVSLGFQEIFLRPTSPYGFAARGKKKLLTDESDFFDFYREGLEYIIDLNRSGTRVVEVWSQILLERMFDCVEGAYVDLSSPSGSGVTGICYNYDGNIYPADEGRMLQEMGDQSFLLGRAGETSYSELFVSEGFRNVMRGGVNQALPGCSDCAYRPHCGGEPIRNYVLQNDSVGVRPTSSACKNHLSTFDLLTDLLTSEDGFVRELLTDWAFLRRRI